MINQSKSPKVIATIEARMGSSRLPGKVLMKIKGKPLLHFLIERLKRVSRIDQIIVATTDKSDDDLIEVFAKSIGISIFRGDESDVLKRIYDTSVYFESDIVIQLTGDNPLIDCEILEKCLVKFMEEKPDSLNTIYSKTFPVGMFINIISFNALKKSHEEADGIYREHVGLFIKDNPDKFNTISLVAEKSLRRPDISITVDEMEDFKFIKEIIEHFEKKNQNFNCGDLLEFLRNNEKLTNINKKIKRRF